jgi:hypothetical protein
LGEPEPVILEGDSRDLTTLLAAHASGAVSSPPYNVGTVGPAGTKDEASLRVAYKAYRKGGGGWPYEKYREDVLCGRRGGGGTYGTADGQLSNLPPGVAPAAGVGSPPYAMDDARGPVSHVKDTDAARAHESMARLGRSCVEGGYGTAPGQLGAEPANTFWASARQILLQLHSVLRPGAVCAWVVKAFVRNKKLVDFPGQWEALCHETGFETVEVAHALLAKRWKEKTLFDGEVVKERSRKSFFRRLAEKRPGAPRIDHEDVTFFRRLP